LYREVFCGTTPHAKSTQNTTLTNPQSRKIFPNFALIKHPLPQKPRCEQVGVKGKAGVADQSDDVLIHKPIPMRFEVIVHDFGKNAQSAFDALLDECSNGF
jgi:hypothetical protein